MHTNIGTTDRVVRIVLALLFLGFFLVTAGPLRWIGLVGIVPLATAFVGFCPLYMLFGFNTCGGKG
ncbi:MAG TPA: DUF2892 domain-containing protein [bacterium]|nr:DUF2892 domain-containing protein [bacterium]